MDNFAGHSHNATDRPSDWNVRSLGELCDFANGLWTGKKPPLVEAKVLRNTNFNNDGTLDLADVAELQVQVSQFEKRQLFPGDIILERSGGGPTQPVGRVVYFGLPAENYSFSNFTTRLRVRDKSALDAKYLLYFLLQFYLRGETEALQKRTTGIRNLNFADYLKVVVLLPPLPEQRRITHALSTIQRAIQAQDTVIAAARELKRSLMHRLFTYGPYAEPLPTKETEIGEVPEGWRTARLGDVAVITTKPKDFSIGAHDHIPFIPMDLVPDEAVEIASYQSRTADEIRSGIYCEPGDVLVAKITPSFENGKQGIVVNTPVGFTYATTEVFPLKAQRDALSPLYLFYHLKQQHVRDDFTAKMEGTTGRQRIPKAVVINHVLPLPPVDVQERIARNLKAVDDLLIAHLRRKNSLGTLFASTLHQLMTGQLRVPDAEN